MIYKEITKYFDPRELLSPAIYDLCGDAGIKMYSPKFLEGVLMLREEFGPMVCNTWHSTKMISAYGLWRDRGLRDAKSKTGSPGSAHRIAGKPLEIWENGIDLVPVRVAVKEVHDRFKAENDRWIPYFTRVESHKPDGTPITWLHLDNRVTGLKKIRFFKP